MSSPPLPMDNSSAIADSKLPPGEDYEEIREQVGAFVSLGVGLRNQDVLI